MSTSTSPSSTSSAAPLLRLSGRERRALAWVKRWAQTRLTAAKRRLKYSPRKTVFDAEEAAILQALVQLERAAGQLLQKRRRSALSSRIALTQLLERLEATREREQSERKPILRDGDKQAFERLWRIVRDGNHLPLSSKREIWHNLTGLLGAWIRQDATPEDLSAWLTRCVEEGRLDIEKEKARGTLDDAFGVHLERFEAGIREGLRKEFVPPEEPD